MYIFPAQFIIFSSLKRYFHGFASFLRLLSHYVITLVQNLANGVTKTNRPTPIGEDLNVFHLTLTLVSQLLALLKAMEIKVKTLRDLSLSATNHELQNTI